MTWKCKQDERIIGTSNENQENLMGTTDKVFARKTRTDKKASDIQSAPQFSRTSILNEMDAFGRRLAQDPEAAREFLFSAGIITAKGKLRKIYGG